MPDLRRLRSALDTAVRRLVGEIRPEGYWEGELSASALATATALSALAAAGDDDEDRALMQRGLEWLERTQLPDGGWGDTPDSPGNLSTTTLAAAAFALAGKNSSPALARADEYISLCAGRSPEERAAAIARVYGRDRTFAAPILLNCALAGMMPWDTVPRLPFELAVFPNGLYKALRLHVVSYALPALISVGLALHRRAPARSPLRRLLRRLAEKPALARLAAIQPSSGGFLEAVPLTSFVAMSMAAASLASHPVTQKCLQFLRAAARPDGGWPIDGNLSVWLTTNAILALDSARALNGIDARKTREWLIGRQQRSIHPYTAARPGGWAWTHLPGGVPDADDTAKAVLALAKPSDTDTSGELAGSPLAAMDAGVGWLLELQNRDGGWPTFCRGWGKLPFDRSSPDVTAHALQALRAVRARSATARVARAVERGLDYLRKSQREDGSWVPLWFGNQLAREKLNPVFGTSSVLPALHELAESELWARGAAYLSSARNEDGGWGGEGCTPSSVEETAAAVTALARAPKTKAAPDGLARGVDWLVRKVEDGSWLKPAPIGLYFSSLWYSERLYPIIWTVESLGEVLSATGNRND